MKRGAPLLLPALAGLATTVLATPVLADDPWPHFVRTGDALTCQSAPGKVIADDMPCLTIGPLAVGKRRKQTETRLGTPAQETKRDGRSYFDYAIGWRNGGQMGTQEVTDQAILAYAADGTVDSIQIMGERMSSRWYFCGLTLGDSEQDLRARMGEPLQTVADGAQGTLWSYGPSISFGVDAGKIATIHISKDLS